MIKQGVPHLDGQRERSHVTDPAVPRVVKDADGIRRDTRSFVEIRREAIRARQTQQFNQDDLDEMKQAGCIGEVHGATIASRSCSLASDPKVAERIQQLVSTENDARAILLRFVVTTSPDLTLKDLPQVTAAYVRMLREKAKPGEWFRGKDGKWVQFK